MKMTPLSLFALWNLFGIGTAMATPSYDCSKAQGQVEERICEDTRLQELDNKLHYAYRSALAMTTAESRWYLRAYQRGWIKGRNACWKSSDLNQCIEANYRTRISELEVQGQLVKPDQEVRYLCGEQSLQVAFYNDTELSLAVIQGLSTSTEPVYAFIDPSASGAKYQGQNLVFWTKADEALLSQYGQQDQQCRVQSLE
ncbi:MliC family protein [Ferrimonas aestuarii]|nr:MliC family protein [Ferrimonas aestuarii]